MEFPEFSPNNDLYDSWNTNDMNRSSDFFDEIDTNSYDRSGSQVVIEDVCFSTQIFSEANKMCESNDNIQTDLTVDKILESFDPNMPTQDSVLHLEQHDYIDHDVKNDTDKESYSSSQIPSLLHCNTSSSKQKPAILVVADSSVSSSGKRGPPGGDPYSKNAIAARDNRLKKKKYIADLENTVLQLKSENDELVKEAVIRRKSVAILQQEVRYLKGVIANQSTLSALLKSVSQTPGINLASSFSQPSTDWLEKNLPYDNEAHSEVSSSVQNKTEMKRRLGSCRSKNSKSSPTPQINALQMQHGSNNKGSYTLRKKRPLCQTKLRPRVCEAKKMKVENATNENDAINIEDDSDTDSDSKNFCGAEQNLPSEACNCVSPCVCRAVTNTMMVSSMLLSL
ncbi:hypothetical protein RRG08_021041 [Elysia crispata]|uniref:BZIP domain-containing protein n=1 Tax=Elysia crispata TaxID=231223 RepID=A0AAE0YQQ7_9GAST|nr:hypothetical protein RRG08_021041 [Elysia crispata]